MATYFHLYNVAFQLFSCLGATSEKYVPIEIRAFLLYKCLQKCSFRVKRRSLVAFTHQSTLLWMWKKYVFSMFRRNWYWKQAFTFDCNHIEACSCQMLALKIQETPRKHLTGNIGYLQNVFRSTLFANKFLVLLHVFHFCSFSAHDPDVAL